LLHAPHDATGFAQGAVSRFFVANRSMSADISPAYPANEPRYREWVKTGKPDGSER
jgi:hypothetical protein